MKTKHFKGERKLQNFPISKGEWLYDSAFHGMEGVTKFSLLFWEKLKSKIDIKGFTVAKMTYREKDYTSIDKWYTLTLTHKEGFKISFKGCSSGYYGEGSRGTQKILEDIGFSGINRIFVHGLEEFTFKRKTA